MPKKISESPEQEGKIVTPLPPNKIHSTEGIVTPKAPLQVEKEQRNRLSDLPENLKDTDEVLYKPES